MRKHSNSWPSPRACVICVFAVGVAVACSASNKSNGQSSTGSGANGGASTADGMPTVSSSGSGASTSAGLTVTSGGGSGGGGCGMRCSANLHDIVDCNGNVLTTCPDNQACGPGPACQDDPCAAAQADGSTIGCDFYSVVPAPEAITRGSCFAAMIANTWVTPITVQVQYNGQMLDMSKAAVTPMGTGANITYQPLTNGEIAPGALALLFLSQGPPGLPGFFAPCPSGVTPGVTIDPSVSGTGLGQAFHITTNAPVVAYDIYPYGGSKSYVSSATLLIPTPAWGTNYVTADGYAEDPQIGYPPFLQIVAAQDNTQVTINPSVDIVSGNGVMATPKNTQGMYMLNQGQVLQFEQDQELAGSVISSNNPVSVWGGASCMNIPVGEYACDSGHQELPAVKSLGREYVMARYRDRLQGNVESPPITIVGAADNTTLTYDPAAPSGAPTSLAVGQMVRFNADQPFSVKSQDDQHPFYVAQHMTGWMQIDPNMQNMTGDPETVNVVPPEQYLDSYLFLTDPTYANTHLVLVRKKAMDGKFKDVTLDCLGTVTGWQPVGSAGKYEYTRVDLVVAGAPVGKCDNGAHVASSQEPFGLTVWGWDVAVSYAYPAGMSILPINNVSVPTTPK